LKRSEDRFAASRRKPPIGLVFCEDENDAESLRQLTSAIWPESPRIDYCRRPLILLRDQKSAEARKKNVAGISAVLKAKNVVAEVVFVIAHQDCDAVEPAHEQLAQRIKDDLSAGGVPNVVAVAPAWETEAWWYLWPNAVAAVNSKWRRLTRVGNHGMMKDAKEQLRRDLRTADARDYEESDSRRIASNVRALQLVDVRVGVCNSFLSFRTELLSAKAAIG